MSQDHILLMIVIIFWKEFYELDLKFLFYDLVEKVSIFDANNWL